MPLKEEKGGDSSHRQGSFFPERINSLEFVKEMLQEKGINILPSGAVLGFPGFNLWYIWSTLPCVIFVCLFVFLRTELYSEVISLKPWLSWREFARWDWEEGGDFPLLP